jgi:hypothetical protein
MPLPLALTDSLGYVDQEDAEAFGWAVVPGSGRISLSFGELQIVDGQTPSMLVTENGAFGTPAVGFSMSRTFQMAASALVGASVANLRVGAPWFDFLSIRVTTGVGTVVGRAEFGMVSILTDGTGIATVTIEKIPGGSYSHVNERYYFANMRLYGTLIGDLPPQVPPTSVVAPLLFTPEMDWSQPLIEDLECETTVVRYDGDTEQRSGLTDIPNRRLTFLVTAETAKLGMLLEALIAAGQAGTFWVPYWRSASWLTVAKTIGQDTLALDTLHKGYEFGQGIMFWQDAFHAEVAELTIVSGTLLTFTPLTSAWAAAGRTRAKVVPVYRGILAPSIPVSYLERSIKQAKVTFDLIV